jgi:outer membrane protein OmpA-like peptidoglycan-associated protein
MKRIILVAATTLAVGSACSQSQRTARQEPVRTEPEQQAPARQEVARTDGSVRQSGFVGARGPDGPAGARGAQGSTGQIGEPGYVAAGPAGPAGPTGATGERGRVGAQGQSGELAAGPAGVTGPAGARGAPGAQGASGTQGASAEGQVGPAGPAGAAGARGATGETGPRGATLVGPAGAAGLPGPAGEQGEVGRTGAQGATTSGVAGTPGPAGPPGAPGATGPTGPQGPVGVVEQWQSYREFWFDSDSAAVREAHAPQLAEMAAYMKANPSLQLGIDASSNPRATERRDIDLAERRIDAVRDALVQAGVADYRIVEGVFGDVNLRRDGRVEVLMRTDQRTTAELDAARRASATAAAGAAGTAATSGTPDRPTDLAIEWTCYRDFWFDADTATIHPADAHRVKEIAAFAKQNPAMRIGIDNGIDHSLNSGRASEADSDLAKRRVDALRQALIGAGVPSSRVTTGAFDDSDQWRDGRVAVLINTTDLLPGEGLPVATNGTIERWASYRDFWFDASTTEIHHADAGKVAEIADYLKQNPSLRIGIDSSLSADEVDQGDLGLATRRGDAVRAALIAAGVPASSIKTGAFGDAELRRDRRVEVLVVTDRFAQRD